MSKLNPKDIIMTSISLPIQRLLATYESLFNDVNQGTKPERIFPGNAQIITDYEEISNAIEADTFFENYGAGNATIGVHNPFERHRAYELLLQILKSYNPVQYHKIHKGTPYYFIGWTSYQNYNFAKAIFYMDAAVSEDLKFSDVQNKKSTRPSLDFFLLKSVPGPSGLATHLALLDIVNNTLQEYKTNGGGSLTIENFSNKFVYDLLYSGPKERSLLTALYTFLLEFQEKEKQINLRSDTGGSIQPFLDHLFDGARILESLLEKRGGTGPLYHKIVKTTAIAVKCVLKGNSTLAYAEQEYNNQIAAGSSFQDCNFASAYIIRNTTGHSLLWPDQFSSGSSYTTLYNNLINSIFWTIEKLWP